MQPKLIKKNQIIKSKVRKLVNKFYYFKENKKYLYIKKLNSKKIKSKDNFQGLIKKNQKYYYIHYIKSINIKYSKKSKYSKKNIKYPVKTTLNYKDCILKVREILKINQVKNYFSNTSMIDAQNIQTKESDKKKVYKINEKNSPICTIDTNNAKDFDDALSAERIKNGYKLMSIITNVSFYIQPYSSINQNAQIKNISLYPSNQCISMLPKQLSNELSSLSKKRNKCCILTQINLSSYGGIKLEAISQAMLKSQMQFTYKKIQNFFNHKQIYKKIRLKIRNCLISLKRVNILLKLAKNNKGSVNFYFKKPIASVIQKKNIFKISKNLLSQLIIENSMIVSNEVICKFIKKHKNIALYRINKQPIIKKIKTLTKESQKLNTISKYVTIKKTKKFATQQLGVLNKYFFVRPKKRILTTILLKTIQQAEYKNNDERHFSLTKKNYLHFTSPIRRYPDIINHRSLKYILNRQTIYLVLNLNQISYKCSNSEKKSNYIESVINQTYLILFMRKNIGKKIKCIITNINNKGIYIKLIKYRMEAIIKTKHRHQYVILKNINVDIPVIIKQKHLFIGNNISITISKPV